MSFKKIFFVVLLIMAAQQNFAQLQYTHFFYLDSDNDLVEEARASYVVKVYKEKPTDVLWIREYSTKVDHKLLSLGYCSDSLGKIFEGAYTFYDYKGNIERKGNYEKDKKIGEWKRYFSSGKTKNIYYFDKGKMVGLNRSWYEEGKLQDSFNLDKNGNGYGIGFYEDGQKMYEGMFAEGVKKGEWKYYYDIPGNIQSMTGVFEKDSLLSSTCFTKEGKVQKECYYENEAVFNSGQSGWVAYLVKAITKSKYAKYMKTGGRYTAIIKFMVDTKGNVVDASVEVPKDENLDRIAENIIAKSPRWQPAMQYNQPVNAYRRQPITFVVE